MKNRIKYLVLDVDGTLTDGKIYMGESGELMKAFNIKDGCGIRILLPKAEIVPVVITSRQSEIVQNRCRELGIDKLFQGVSDKVGKMLEFLAQNGATPGDVAYAGDDLNDLECMNLVKSCGGCIGVPSDACRQVKEIADYITVAKGGDGAVREFIEWLLNRV